MKRFNFLPNINLIDEYGESHNFHDLIEDKTIILNMFYSNCEIKCIPLGKLLGKVNLLLNKHLVKNNIHFISITLDADNDTVDDIKRFKTKVHDEAKSMNWHFYTGNYREIESLRYKLGMYSPEPEIDEVKSNHSGNFLIFNEELGFLKHTNSFDNPLDIARKVIQMVPINFRRHSYKLNELNYDALTDDEIFENIHTMNSVFTVPFLPKHLREKYDKYGELQRGFQYDPLSLSLSKEDENSETENSKKSKTPCCCKKKITLV